jgi:hypothetical protein
MGDILWHLHLCWQCILIKITPSITLPHPPHPLLRTISKSSTVLFPHMYIKSTHHSHPFPWFFLPTLHFLKLYIDNSRGFRHDISHMYILWFNHTKLSITPSVMLLPCSSSTAFSTSCYTTSIHTCLASPCYLFSIILSCYVSPLYCKWQEGRPRSILLTSMTGWHYHSLGACLCVLPHSLFL